MYRLRKFKPVSYTHLDVYKRQIYNSESQENRILYDADTEVDVARGLGCNVNFNLI